MTAVWHIEVLGHLRVQRGAVVHTRFYSQKAASLLARLACHPHRQFGREEVIEWLWPDSEARAGRASLRSVLSSLRRQLEPPDLPAGSILATDYLHIALNPDAVSTDVAAFETLCTQADKTADADECERWLSAATALYTGELLPGFYDEWILTERERLAQRFVRLLQQRVSLAEARQDGNAALAAALRWAAMDICDEQANRTLLRLLMAQPQREAAQRHYAQMWRAWETQLGAPLPPEVQREAAQWGLHPPTPRASAARVQKKARADFPAGTHQPLDIALSAPVPAVFPAREILSVAANTLPSPPLSKPFLPPTFTRFFGREREIADLCARLQDGEARLLTVSGAGGIGKTRLAIEVARRFAGTGDRLVAFVPLAEVCHAGEIAEAVLAALHVPPTSQGNALDNAVHLLNQRPALLVLDNFEQIADDGADVVRALLERVPALHCLVTSRRRLDVSGERDYPLAPLPVPAPDDAPEQLLQVASVQLLLDRARAARPDFQVTARNAEAIAAVCAQLEGLPLAIELTAARAHVLSPAQMRTELSRRLEFLVTRRRDVADRHKSLRATLDWSYQLLSRPAQRFLAHVSVFQGTWTRQAAETVCQETNALALLEELRASSLILAEESDEVLRFRMLETVNEYGAERLRDETAPDTEPSPADIARERHYAYFLQLAEAANAHADGAQHKVWLDRLEREHDNLRAALRWCQSASAPSESGLRLADALWRFWSLRGYRAEGAAWLEWFLQQDAEAGDGPRRASALQGMGLLAWGLGDPAAAQNWHTRSLAIYRRLEDVRGIATALTNLGLVHYRGGDYPAARALHEESLTRYRTMQDAQGIAEACINLANILRLQGEWESCAARYEESIALCQQIGNRALLARAITSLAILRHAQEDFAEARVLHEQALALRRELGNRPGTAYSLNSYGVALRVLEAYEESLAAFQEAIVLFREVGDRQGLASALGNAALCLSEQGRAPEILPLLREALTLWQATGFRYLSGVLDCLEGLARFESANARGQRAARLFGIADVLRAAPELQPTTPEREQMALARAHVRAVVGASAWEKYWREGQSLTREHALNYALSLIPLP